MKYNGIKYTTLFAKQLLIKDTELFHLNKFKCNPELSKEFGRLKARSDSPVVTMKNFMKTQCLQYKQQKEFLMFKRKAEDCFTQGN